MKINSAKYFIILAWILLFIVAGCKKQDTLPTVITNAVTDFGTDYAVLGGDVISNGDSYVTAEGVCWSNHQNPTLSDNHDSRGTGKGGFSIRVVTLFPCMIYFIRAYATNNSGTAYGNQVTLITLCGYSPLIHTERVTGVSATSAISISSVNMDRMEVNSRGVCWSTSRNPTILDNITTDGAGVGGFTSSITGTIPNTAYYLRAYATNSVGTSYGNEISFATEQPSGPTVSDIEGNLYHTIIIGNQVWMVENLKTTKYRNGDPIPNVTDWSAWLNLATGAYCNYENDPNNSTFFGKLYNWNAVNDIRNIAPAGWHIPSDTEWTTLTDWLTNNGYGYDGSGSDIAKSIAGKSGWNLSKQAGAVGNDQAINNSSGFTAFPGGSRFFFPGDNVVVFGTVGYYGYWWSSTEFNTLNAFRRMITNNSTDINNYNYGFKVDGLSVRCVKD